MGEDRVVRIEVLGDNERRRLEDAEDRLVEACMEVDDIELLSRALKRDWAGVDGRLDVLRREEGLA